MVKIRKVDETFIRIDCEQSVLYEIAEHFTFYAAGYEFSPEYKKGHWDGKIRLLNRGTRLIYYGLLDRVKDFCETNGYETEVSFDTADAEFSVQEAEDFTKSLGLPFEPYDYQIEAFVHSIRKRRCLLLSPTASGKSLLIYITARYYNKKTLIVCPTIQLVRQMSSDFKDYGYSSDVHQIFAGQQNTSDRLITISTWQSICDLPKSWFGQYGVVFGDEAHGFKAKSLVKIMTSLDACPHRFACTGTLDGVSVNEQVIEGLFGPKKIVTTTSQLIKDGRTSDLKINAIRLNYPRSVRKKCSDMSYTEEIDFIVGCEPRNKFIKNLALSLKTNTLILFRYVQKHGHILNEMIAGEADPSRCVSYIHGGVEVDDREAVRRLMEKENNAIAIASEGTFSTGINIKNIHNIIFSSPTKSKIKVLQSIGRGLRKHSSKEHLTLFDIGDDLVWRNKENTTLKHFKERIFIYAREDFKYKMFDVSLGAKE
jgi:Kyanoviridae DNA helicase